MSFKRVKEKYQFIVEGKDILILFGFVAVLVSLSFAAGIIIGKSLVEKAPQAKLEQTPSESRESVTSPEPVSPPARVKIVQLSEPSKQEIVTQRAESKPTDIEGKPSPPSPQGQPEVKEGSAPLAGGEEKQKSPSEKPGSEKAGPPAAQVRKTPSSAPAPQREATLTPRDKTKGKREIKQEKKKQVAQATPGKKTKKYTVQVASYRSRTDAISLVQRLKRLGFDAYLMTADLGEKGIWYRVRVGYFYSKDKAREVVKKLQRYRFKPIITEVDR